MLGFFTANCLTFDLIDRFNDIGKVLIFIYHLDYNNSVFLLFSV